MASCPPAAASINAFRPLSSWKLFHALGHALCIAALIVCGIPAPAYCASMQAGDSRLYVKNASMRRNHSQTCLGQGIRPLLYESLYTAVISLGSCREQVLGC